jgi:hypothetical protein
MPLTVKQIETTSKALTGTGVYRRKHQKNQMSDQKQTVHSQHRSRTIVRTITIGGNFTRNECEAPSKIASDNEQLLGEWASEMQIRQRQTEEADLHFISVVIGIELLLMKTLAQRRVANAAR